MTKLTLETNMIFFCFSCTA